MKNLFVLIIFLVLNNCSTAQLNTPKYSFTKADSLRGSNNENRDWWDVLSYEVLVKPDFENKEIEGVISIKLKNNLDSFIKKGLIRKFLQIDLQDPLVIDKIECFASFKRCHNKGDSNSFTKLNEGYNEIIFEKTDGVYLVNVNELQSEEPFDKHPLKIYFHGKPKEAKKAPWDGGWIWSKDSLGRPFVSVACQGLGASCWFPCKDYQGDEPEEGSMLKLILPDTSALFVVGNGRDYRPSHLTRKNGEFLLGKNEFRWGVSSPINTYCIVPYIGIYNQIQDTFNGEKGILTIDFFHIDYNKQKAEEQFKQVKPMLKAFEYWFGAYPFYEDGYKLVEAPFLGMEHQSAIAYGNKFKQGYNGRDLSGTGWGLKWDFIIVHESGHEWFANSITTKDIADMWVHEGFTNYSEVLFTEYYYGKQAANEYCYGIRKNIKNDIPIIGQYGVNNEGSGDMYYKAANMIHAIRNNINDDEKFRSILRGMNEIFYHKTVTTQEIEQFIIDKSGIDFSSTFNQYLRTTQIPKMEYYFTGKKLHFRYVNCNQEFNMPLTIPSTNKKLKPTTEWKTKRLRGENKDWFNKKNIEFLYLLNVEEVKPIED